MSTSALSYLTLYSALPIPFKCSCNAEVPAQALDDCTEYPNQESIHLEPSFDVC